MCFYKHMIDHYKILPEFKEKISYLKGKKMIKIKREFSRLVKLKKMRRAKIQANTNLKKKL